MFRRAAATSSTSSTSSSGQVAATETAPGTPSAKGRPTPRRRDAEAARRTSVINQGRRSGARGGKGGARVSRQEAALRREAARRGDESALPARDRGPVRRLVRDVVDSRRNVPGGFIYIAVPSIVLTFSRVPILVAIGIVLLYGFIVSAVVDLFLMSRKVVRLVHERYPNERTQGLRMYAAMRAIQLRRGRIPAPRVERGAKI